MPTTLVTSSARLLSTRHRFSSFARMSGTLRSTRPVPRTLLLVLFAGTMLLRLLVPQGWMPVTDGSGFHLTLCSGSGPVAKPARLSEMSASMHGRHHMPPGQDHPNGDHPCAFGGLSHALANPVLPAFSPAVGIEQDVLATLFWLIGIGHGLAAPPPPATGPPLAP